uniref:hypothetical protein n=1 Tax=Flavobacterium sp. TaxID=239 RepID=UPI00404A6F12
MKNIIKLLFIVVFGISTSLKAQYENRISTSTLDFSIEYFKPITFGSNAIHKAHDSNIGMGFETHCRVYKAFRFGFGFNFASYTVTNRKLIGNYNNTNYNCIFLALNYNIPLSNKFGIVPELSIGKSRFKGKNGSKNYGVQGGSEYCIGIKTIYNLSGGVGVFHNLNYVYNNLDMKANPGIINFYNQSHAINFGFGIIFF